MTIFTPRSQLIYLLVCLIISLISFSGLVDNSLQEMLLITLSVFALARGLNGVISVAQGTELSVEPMGVGVTLTPGQILDPLNDMVEQFSTVLLIASASLGIQKIVLFLGDNLIIKLTLSMLILIVIALSFSSKPSNETKSWLVKSVLILTLLRLFIPGVVFISNEIQTSLKQHRNEAISTLVQTKDSVDSLAEETDKPRDWFNSLKENIDIKAKLVRIQEQAESAIEAALYLLAEFFFVMILLPITVVFVLYKSITLIGRK